ncbi:MAG: hypothetical protein NT080_14240 [Spirochaetes bacterium]|nr:hypothetical protein [Spirochaetota bacterium]
MSGDGLLKKAQHKVDEHANPTPPGADVTENTEVSSPGDFAFDESSGISRDDQKEILNHIEKIATSNRISSDPSIWQVQARKNGLALPVIVNVAAVCIIALGLVFLSSSFSRRKNEQATGTAKLSSAEGRLIQELKKEVDVQLKEKDKELAAVQERMKTLDEEKSRIITDMEARIKAKEVELAARLEYEIQKEREKLFAQGLNEAVIQERLKKFEAEKKREFENVLDEFRKKADVDRRQMEDNLQKLREEYKANLSTINAERQGLLEDARKREQELRSALDERSKALEEARSKANAGLEQARSELSRLNDQMEKSKSAEDRLIGLYAGIRDAVYEKRYNDAAAAIISLKAYVDDPSVAELPSMQKRRPADLFVIDALSRFVESEKAKSAVDLSRLAESATLLATIRVYSDNAASALRQGDVVKAEELYRLSLSAIPEIAAASAYFIARMEETEKSRSAAIEKSIAGIEASYDSGDYLKVQSGFDQLMVALAITPARRSTLAERIWKSGDIIEDQAKRLLATKNAATALETARRMYDAGRYEDAVMAYVELASKYPDADQLSQAFDGIRRGARSLASTQAAAPQDTTAFQKEIEDLRKAFDAEQKKNADLARTNGELAQRNADLQKRNGELTRQVAGSETAAPDPSAAELATTRETLARTTTERDALIERVASLERRAESFRVVAVKFESLLRQFTAYARAEDATFAKGGTGAYLDARGKLDEFLATRESLEAMPDLCDRFRRYERAFQEAGQAEVVLNFIGILEDLASIPSRDGKLLYLDEKSRGAGDESMKTFLNKLRDTI